MTELENVYNSSKSACTWTRDLTQHHFFITKQHFLARILGQWLQQITSNLHAWTPRRWELKRTLFDPSTFVDNWERAETWIATRFQNEFESLLNLSKGSNHEAKFVHTNWSKIIKVGTQTKWVWYLCRNFDLAFLEFVWLRSVAKSKMWNFLDEESAHYFQFFNHLKEKKTFFESSFLKKA